MPGSPILYYGDEIGMGDNVFIGDRNGVRTPMQWSPDRNAGFSRADPQRLYLPPIMDPVYGYQSINVEAQLRDPSSLLSWTKRMLAVRKTSQAFGRGTRRFLKPGNRKILAYLREYGDDSILCVANLSRSAQPVELNLSAFKGRVPVEMLGRTTFPPIGDLPYLLTLAAYGFYWFKLTADAEAPVVARTDPRRSTSGPCWCCSTAGAACSATAWCRGASAWRRRPGCNSRPTRCPRFIETQRWYAAKGSVHRARAHRRSSALAGRQDELAHRAARGPRRRRGRELFHAARARLGGARRGPRPPSVDFGGRQGAPAVERRRDGRCVCRRSLLPRASWPQWREPRDIATAQGKLQFRPTAAFGRLAGDDFAALPAARPHSSISNTVVVMGERLMLKGRRRLQAGASPELEMGLYLTEVVHFPQLRAARRCLAVRGQRWRDAAARAAAGLCRQSGRRLDLLSRVFAPASRGAPHGARRRCAARQCARGVFDADSHARQRAPQNCTWLWPRRREMQRLTRSRSHAPISTPIASERPTRRAARLEC